MSSVTETPNRQRHRRRDQFQRRSRKLYDEVIDQLVAARMAQGMTQTDVDELIGCSERQVSKWEAKMHYPSSYYLMVWCDALDVKIRITDE